jgi:hypothetical protein
MRFDTGLFSINSVMQLFENRSEHSNDGNSLDRCENCAQTPHPVNNDADLRFVRDPGV